jgi:uncharacterized protein YdaU (DUF1376 family)
VQKKRLKGESKKKRLKGECKKKGSRGSAKKKGSRGSAAKEKGSRRTANERGVQTKRLKGEQTPCFLHFCFEIRLLVSGKKVNSHG